MYCSQCGKQTPDNINFCQYCGTPVLHSTPSPAPVIAEQPIEAPILSAMIEDRPNGISTEKDGKKGLGIIGLVLSCVGLGISVILCFYGGMMLGIPLCIAGIILSAVSIKSISTKAVAMTGLIVGIVGVAIGFFMMRCFFAALEGNSEIAYYFKEFMEQFFDY